MKCLTFPIVPWRRLSLQMAQSILQAYCGWNPMEYMWGWGSKNMKPGKYLQGKIEITSGQLTVKPWCYFFKSKCTVGHHSVLLPVCVLDLAQPIVCFTICWDDASGFCFSSTSVVRKQKEASQRKYTQLQITSAFKPMTYANTMTHAVVSSHAVWSAMIRVINGQHRTRAQCTGMEEVGHIPA